MNKKKFSKAFIAMLVVTVMLTVFVMGCADGCNPTDPPSTYTVTFDVNGGAGGNFTREVAEGEGLPADATAARTGYTFVGWSLARDSVGSLIGSAFVVTEPITVFAFWVEEGIEIFTVTFDVNGGAGGNFTQVYPDGTILGSTTIPTLDGKLFMGWTTVKNDSNTQFMMSDRVVKNMTLYALWADDTLQNRVTAATLRTLKEFTGYRNVATGELEIEENDVTSNLEVKQTMIINAESGTVTQFFNETDVQVVVDEYDLSFEFVTATWHNKDILHEYLLSTIPDNEEDFAGKRSSTQADLDERFAYLLMIQGFASTGEDFTEVAGGIKFSMDGEFDITVEIADGRITKMSTPEIPNYIYGLGILVMSTITIDFTYSTGGFEIPALYEGVDFTQYFNLTLEYRAGTEVIEKQVYNYRWSNDFEGILGYHGGPTPGPYSDGDSNDLYNPGNYFNAPWGYEFDGLFRNANFTNAVTETFTLTADTTVFVKLADWEHEDIENLGELMRIYTRTNNQPNMTIRREADFGGDEMLTVLVIRNFDQHSMYSKDSDREVWSSNGIIHRIEDGVNMSFEGWGYGYVTDLYVFSNIIYSAYNPDSITKNSATEFTVDGGMGIWKLTVANGMFTKAELVTGNDDSDIITVTVGVTSPGIPALANVVWQEAWSVKFHLMGDDYYYTSVGPFITITREEIIAQLENIFGYDAEFEIWLNADGTGAVPNTLTLTKDTTIYFAPIGYRVHLFSLDYGYDYTTMSYRATVTRAEIIAYLENYFGDYVEFEIFLDEDMTDEMQDGTITLTDETTFYFRVIYD